MLLLVAVALSSCREVSRHRALRDLWTYIDAAPDSALRVLEAMPSEHFLLPGDRADYALLKSIALDKNYIDVTDDSLARIATDWYDVHGRPERKLRAWYYLGRVQQNAGNPSGAIVSFQKAKQLAEKTGDLFYEGMACRAMGEVYRDAFFEEEALESMRHAHDCFVASGHAVHAKYALMQLARIQYINGAFEDCENSIMLLRQQLDTTKDTQLLVSCSMIQASCSIQNGDFRRGIDLYTHAEKCLAKGFSTGTLGLMAYAYRMVNQKDSAALYLGRAFEKISSTDELVDAKYDRYRILNADRRYESAISDLHDVLLAQDSTFHTILNQSVVAAQRDAYKDSYQKEEYNNRIMKGGIFLSAIILCLVTAFIFLYIKKNRTDRENTIYQVISLQNEIRSIEKRTGERDLMISHLFQKRLAFINSISTSYLREASPNEVNKDYYKTIEKEIHLFRQDEHIYEDLEKIVNYTSDNVMDYLRQEIQLTGHLQTSVA